MNEMLKLLPLLITLSACGPSLTPDDPSAQERCEQIHGTGVLICFEGGENEK